MSLTVVGISHRTAPLEVRERFVVDASTSVSALRRLATTGCTEAVLLSTCNRTELYMRAPVTQPDAGEIGARLLSDHAGMPETDAERYLYRLNGDRVVEHLFRVVTSLDSLMLGEAQIQGQVKAAYERAAGAQGGDAPPGPVLARLFETALRVGGRVRSETKLGAGAASVPSAAIELARKIGDGDLPVQLTCLRRAAGRRRRGSLRRCRRRRGFARAAAPEQRDRREHQCLHPRCLHHRLHRSDSRALTVAGA
jgi:glutamyl-tRNA reductase